MESGDEDTAFTLGERDWQKMKRDLSKQGYRDGKNEGREHGMQQSFEKATSVAMKHSMRLGQFQGLLECVSSTLADKEQVKEDMDKLTAKTATCLDDIRESQYPMTEEQCSLKESDWEKQFDELINEYMSLPQIAKNTTMKELCDEFRTNTKSHKT